MGFYLAFRLKYARFAINKTKKNRKNIRSAALAMGKRKTKENLKKTENYR